MRGAPVTASFLFLAVSGTASGADLDRPDPQEPSESALAKAKLPPLDLPRPREVTPQPSVSAGLLLGVCGSGDPRPWRTTQFCLGTKGDLLWGRTAYAKPGGGVSVLVSTAGFSDVRGAVSATGLFPLFSWVTLGLDAGPLVRKSGEWSYGIHTALELGQRTFSRKGHYRLSHALVVGFDWTAKTHSNPDHTTIVLGVRLDGYWLSAPALLFR